MLRKVWSFWVFCGFCMVLIVFIFFGLGCIFFELNNMLKNVILFFLIWYLFKLKISLCCCVINIRLCRFVLCFFFVGLCIVMLFVMLIVLGYFLRIKFIFCWKIFWLIYNLKGRWVNLNFLNGLLKVVR